MEPTNSKQVFIPASKPPAFNLSSRFSTAYIDKIAPWPWVPLMITAVNCYALWSLSWMFLVFQTPMFSYRGRNLGFSYVYENLFELTIPQLFLFYAVALSIFSIVSTVLWTYKFPNLWKRIYAVSIFAIIAMGLPLWIISLREYTYEKALEEKFQLEANYNEQLLLEAEHKIHGYIDDNPYSEWIKQDQQYHDEEIRLYELKYHNETNSKN